MTTPKAASAVAPARSKTTGKSGASRIAEERSETRRRRSVSPKKAAPLAKSAKPAPPKKAKAAPAERTSVLLRKLLEENDKKSFTIAEISESLGASSFGVSLLVFSIPEVIPMPVPGMSAVVGIPTAIVSAQMAMGKKELRLPKWILRRKVPRKAVTAAVKTILPLLERIEKAAKPRGGRWVTNPLTQRLLGLFIFLLAIVITLPVPGTNMPPAIAIFVTSLGVIERDGLLICLGILIGLASIVLIGGVAYGTIALLRNLVPF